MYFVYSPESSLIGPMTSVSGRSYLQWLILQARILQSDGQSFQDLFCSIMEIAEQPDFKKVKPHGSAGDRKNDGFNQKTGCYYQVYAPEDPESRITTACKKAAKDFKGLCDFWEKVCPIKAYYFVFNDKFKGSFPELLSTLLILKNENPQIDTLTNFTCEDLVKKFLSLSDADRTRIIGHCPNPEDVLDIDYVALQDVVRHLESLDESVSTEKLVAPEFLEKIKFNKLGPDTTKLLLQGSYQLHALESFFADAPEKKSVLQKKFKGLYEYAKTKPSGELSDLVFFEVINSASPRNTKEIHNAIIVLMAYYFESCDIYEEPHSSVA